MKNADMPAMPMPMTMMGADAEHIANEPEFGLTKREYFAGLAMQGILANKHYEPPRRQRLDGMAEDAVAAADALLAELERKQ